SSTAAVRDAASAPAAVPYRAAVYWQAVPSPRAEPNRAAVPSPEAAQAVPRWVFLAECCWRFPTIGYPMIGNPLARCRYRLTGPTQSSHPAAAERAAVPCRVALRAG